MNTSKNMMLGDTAIVHTDNNIMLGGTAAAVYPVTRNKLGHTTTVYTVNHLILGGTDIGYASKKTIFGVLARRI